MSRVHVACVFAVALLSTLWSSVSRAAEPKKKPNVLVFVADDLGWNDLGCTGSTFYETPNIDSLAARGCMFTSAYASCPVCSPTRASLMTGKYPQRTHITDFNGGPQPDEAAKQPKYKDRLLPAPHQEFLSLEETTVGEMFKSEGYSTIFLGKWHLGGDPYLPINQGFDTSIGAGHNGSPGKDGYFSPYNVPLSPGPKGEHLDLRLANESAKWLRERKTDSPFLLWMSFYDPHVPLMAPAETIKYFEEKKKKLALEDKFGEDGASKVRLTQCHPTYAAMIKTMDDAVGIILNQLKAQNQLDDTIIFFTSDNGGLATAEGSPTSNLPLRAGKGWSYEGGTRVPLIAIVPGITKPGSKTDQRAISMDISATVQTACGFAKPAAPDGISLLPALEGKNLPERDLFWHYPHYGNQGGVPFSSILSNNFKLIEFHDARKGIELYDLAADPSETNNIAPANAEKVKELHEKLAAWKKDVGAIDASKR